MPKVGDVIADKYQVEQLIGVGGMGAVFAATHRFTGKRVALKVMLPELATDEDAVQRFLREANAAGRINHPNVVDVYDVGQHEGSNFLVMEYLHGEPLTSAMARRDMTPTEVLALIGPAMRGVAAAHRQGVVHRDLKPDNIFLAYEEDGVRREAKVLDFGISKLSNEGPLNPRLTKTGAVVGTPYYMSPEQIRGSSQLDKRADVYAFGVILYEALTGRVPFHADTYGALVLEIATGTPAPPDQLVPGMPSELSRVVLRAMARDAAQRYPNIESLISALESHASQNNTRVDGRSTRTSNSPVSLDATRVSASSSQYGSVPQVATVPHLASTPFAAELSDSGSQRKKKQLYGAVGFVAAAALVVAGVWYLTRVPEPLQNAAIVMPATLPTQPVPPVAATAPVISPNEPTDPSGNVPGVAAEAVQPTATPESAARNAAAATLQPSAAQGRRPGMVVHKHVPGRAYVDAEPAEPAQAAPAENSAQPTHRGPRSGVLNVSEF
jgi:serine/threonine protein kinase